MLNSTMAEKATSAVSWLPSQMYVPKVAARLRGVASKVNRLYAILNILACLNFDS